MEWRLNGADVPYVMRVELHGQKYGWRETGTIHQGSATLVAADFLNTVTLN
jgi:hypothetical protein